jgi:hypothetical protein
LPEGAAKPPTEVKRFWPFVLKNAEGKTDKVSGEGLVLSRLDSF